MQILICTVDSRACRGFPCFVDDIGPHRLSPCVSIELSSSALVRHHIPRSLPTTTEVSFTISPIRKQTHHKYRRCRWCYQRSASSAINNGYDRDALPITPRAGRGKHVLPLSKDQNSGTLDRLDGVIEAPRHEQNGWISNLPMTDLSMLL